MRFEVKILRPNRGGNLPNQFHEMYFGSDSPISTEKKEDDVPNEASTSTDNKQKKPVVNKLSKLFIILIAMFVAAAIPVAYYRTKADNDMLLTVQRELQAGARIKNHDIRGVRVYRSADKLVASWYDGTQQCTDVPIIAPNTSSELYGTAPVTEDSGKCVTSSSSRGINPEGN